MHLTHPTPSAEHHNGEREKKEETETEKEKEELTSAYASDSWNK
jgi:hypothetical protein